MSSWKRDAASGLVVLIPLLVTAYVIVYLYGILAGLPFLQSVQVFPNAPALNALTRVLLTLVVFVLLVFSVGYLMRTAVGTLLEGVIDDVMNRLPGLRVVYNASKMAIETALTGTGELQKPVKIETWDGLRMTAFKTGKTTEDGREVLFLPTAPNITTGFVVEADPDDFEETDERVEEALTRILSAGFGEQGERGVPIDVEEES
ncbi:MAG: DUF502 domain-containing protein [Halobacteriaceae archaeon]